MPGLRHRLETGEVGRVRPPGEPAAAVREVDRDEHDVDRPGGHQRDECQVEPREPDRGQPDQHADRAGDRAGDEEQDREREIAWRSSRVSPSTPRSRAAPPAPARSGRRGRTGCRAERDHRVDRDARERRRPVRAERGQDEERDRQERRDREDANDRRPVERAGERAATPARSRGVRRLQCLACRPGDRRRRGGVRARAAR